MERGPLALFGAIVAVGLGPALWLGAQFGRYDAVPTRSPVSVDQRQTGTAQLMGGTGAGDSQTGDNHTAVRSKPRSHPRPQTAGPSHSPSAAATSPTASPSGDPSSPVSRGGPSASPSQSTGPTDGDGGQNSESPSPPATGGGESGPGSGGTSAVNLDGAGDPLQVGRLLAG